ncbi:MAG: hypothetical protein ACK4TA_13695 [Saprospiraceae bacterium]
MKFINNHIINSIFYHSALRTVQVVALLFLLASAACSPEETEAPKPDETPKELTLLEPINGAKQIATHAKLIWKAVPNAIHYTLTISYYENLEEPVLLQKNLTDTTYILQENINKSTVYYWSVTAHVNNGAEVKAPQVYAFRTELAAATASPGISKYYVSPNGVDRLGGGTPDKPFKTLGYASRVVPPMENDTIYLMPGVYQENEAALIGLGVNVIGAGADQTILISNGVEIAKNIDTTSLNYHLWYDGTLIQLVSPHTSDFRDKYSTILPPQNGNQEIAGFTIDGQNKKLKAGIWVENRHHVIMHHVIFKNLSQRGAVFAAGDKRWYEEPAYYLKGIKIHDCTFINSGKDNVNESLGNLNIAQLDGAEIYNIKITDNEGYGIKFIYDGYFKNTSIHDCTIELNETDKLWGEDIAIELWNLGKGNEVYNIRANTWLSFVSHPEIFAKPTQYEHLKAHHIQIIDKDGNSSKEGIEIGMTGIEVSDCYIENKGFAVAIWNMGRENILIRNNVFYNTAVKNNWAGGPAIYIDNSKNWNFKNIAIYNNIFDRHNIGIHIKGNRILNIDIKNNAFINIKNADVQAVGNIITVQNNIKYSPERADWTLTGVSTSTNNYIGDPGYIYKGNRWDTYYKPQTGSFVIDKGIDVGLPYKGNAPDIGFSEY